MSTEPSLAELTPEMALKNFTNMADATPLTREQRNIMDRSAMLLRSAISDPKSPAGPDATPPADGPDASESAPTGAPAEGEPTA